jgi:hypothetical protein
MHELLFPEVLVNVGLNLLGRVAPKARPQGLLSEIETWVHGECAGNLVGARYERDALGRAFLFLQLHPLSRGTRFVDLGEHRIQVVADTAPVGPGYHVYHCDLLKKLATAFGITWELGNHDRGTGDPTGYFETGDEMALYRAMLHWFQELAVATLVEAQDAGGPVSILLPDGVAYVTDERVATPMGPKSLEWLELVASRPMHAIPIFPWWEAGDAVRAMLSRAIGQMWTDVRWRAPLTKAEHGLMLEIVSLLETVHAAQPTLDLPWREWAEIYRYLGASGPTVQEVAAHADLVEGPLIGYRRGNVRRRVMGGWSLEVPGSFAEKWEDRSTWVGWDEGRSVWLTCFANRTGKAPEIPHQLALGDGSTTWGEVLEYQNERVLGSALLDRSIDEEGEKAWQLATRSAVAGHLAVATICYVNDDDRGWSLSTWRSIQHESSAAPPQLLLEAEYEVTDVGQLRQAH